MSEHDKKNSKTAASPANDEQNPAMASTSGGDKKAKKTARKRKSSTTDAAGGGDAKVPAKCQYCKTTYASASSLRGHLSTRHHDTHAAYRAMKLTPLTGVGGDGDEPAVYTLEDGTTSATPPEWVTANFNRLAEDDHVNGCGYTCLHCYYLAHSEREMVRHVFLIHRPEVPRTCPYCPQEKKFKAANALRAHISAKHRQQHKEARAKEKLASSSAAEEEEHETDNAAVAAMPGRSD